MRISGIKTPTRINFTPNNAIEKNPEKYSSYTFCGSNEATKVDAAILVASALIGLLIYLGLAPQGKKSTSNNLEFPQKDSKKMTFNQNPKKNITVNRPSNKYRQKS